MKYIKFDCGCKFPIENNHVVFNPILESIPLDCKKTWDLLSSGQVIGCFQLESHIGRHFAKLLKPNNIEHLAALIAILRPGSLNNDIDGKSATMHYIDRKNGTEPIEYYHSALEPILNKILKEKEKYGFKKSNKKKVVIEFPSPNTNKPLHLGHLRNMALGESISNILESQGYNVIRVNLNNDRGIHICKSMLAYKK